MLHRIENLLLNVGALAVMVLGALIASNVLLRAVFGYSLPDSVVIASELMVAAVILPLAAVTAARAHVSVEFIANHLSHRAQAWLIAIGSLIGFLALIPLLYSGWRELSTAWESGGFFFGDLSLPKWPGRLFFVAGVCICLLRLAQLFVVDAIRAWHGEYPITDHNGEH